MEKTNHTGCVKQKAWKKEKSQAVGHNSLCEMLIRRQVHCIGLCHDIDLHVRLRSKGC
jgi:hypothetical protein